MENGKQNRSPPSQATASLKHHSSLSMMRMKITVLTLVLLTFKQRNFRILFLVGSRLSSLNEESSLMLLALSSTFFTHGLAPEAY